MFKRFKLFFNKLTVLSKILLGILSFSILFGVIYSILSIRYISENNALFNIKNKSFYKENGLTFKSRFNYKHVNFNENKIEYKLTFQTSDLKIYNTNIIILYTLNENYIKDTNIISNEIEINENEFNDYILNLTTNHTINELIKDNKSLLKKYIKEYFIKYKMYDLKNVLIITPLKSE